MTGRTSRWFPTEPDMRLYSTEPHLLLEDFNIKIVPYRHGGNTYELSTQGISSVHVKNALRLWENRNGLDDFIEAVASSLLTDHIVWLEVVFDCEPQDHSPFRVVQANGVIKTARDKLIQTPPAIPSHRHRCGNKTGHVDQAIELDKDRMVHVGLPKKYSSDMLRKMVEDLVDADSHYTLMPPWVKEQLSGQRRNIPAFDVNESNRTRRLRIAQATLPIGWPARDTYYRENRIMSEYYHFWRELRFLHFRASMREQAEKALQQVLNIAGSHCGFEASVTAHNLYTPSKVEEIIKDFEAGKIPFSEVVEITFENAIGYQCKRTITCC